MSISGLLLSILAGRFVWDMSKPLVFLFGSHDLNPSVSQSCIHHNNRRHLWSYTACFPAVTLACGSSRGPDSGTITDGRHLHPAGSCRVKPSHHPPGLCLRRLKKPTYLKEHVSTQRPFRTCYARGKHAAAPEGKCFYCQPWPYTTVESSATPHPTLRHQPSSASFAAPRHPAAHTPASKTTLAQPRTRICPR